MPAVKIKPMVLLRWLRKTVAKGETVPVLAVAKRFVVSVATVHSAIARHNALVRRSGLGTRISMRKGPGAGLWLAPSRLEALATGFTRPLRKIASPRLRRSASKSKT